MAYTGTSAVSDTDADIQSSVHSSGYLLEITNVLNHNRNYFSTCDVQVTPKYYNYFTTIHLLNTTVKYINVLSQGQSYSMVCINSYKDAILSEILSHLQSMA